MPMGFLCPEGRSRRPWCLSVAPQALAMGRDAFWGAPPPGACWGPFGRRDARAKHSPSQGEQPPGERSRRREHGNTATLQESHDESRGLDAKAQARGFAASQR